ncbi:unnamed protein product, partial [Sphacelaria rigidula]
VPAGPIALRARYSSEANGLPITVVSTKIRLLKGGAPRVYRVILQPGLGCCVGFCCTHDIGTGDAGKVWEDAGFSQIVDSGEYDGAR